MKRLAITLLTAMLFLVSSCSSSENTVNTAPPEDEPTTTLPSGPEEGLNVGDIAPDIELVTMDGEVQNLSDYRGKVVFLNFWASWCGPCRAEMPSMQKLHEEYQGEGLVILAVDVGEDRQTVEGFMDELGLTFPAFLDENKEVYKEYNKSGGIPQSYIIDKEGIIREYIPGSKDWGTLEARSSIIRLLGGKND